MKNVLIAILFFMQWFEALLYTEPHIKALREGNYFLKDKKYDQAETEYRRSIDLKSPNPQALYNLGVKSQVLNKYDEAIVNYNQSLKNLKDKHEIAYAYHNIGNAYIKKQEWANAIQAYKQALKKNPSDMDTKYNLAYAQLKLKKQQERQQQQQQQNQPKDQDKNQDKNQDKKDESKGKTPPKQNKDEQKNKEEQQKNDKLSKEQMQRILNALNSQDQKANEKMKQANKESNMFEIEKDW